jgi:serine/threonine protein kinase
VAAKLIDIGPPAHDDEKAALKFLADGLPSSAIVFTNPWLVEPSGAVYELDAVVVMPHAVYVVEIKGWARHLRGDVRDWYIPDARRSPLLLAHKTAQVLHSLMARQSYDASRVWVQELVFLPAAASFASIVDGVRKRVALRGEIHAVLQDATRIRDLANRRSVAPVTDEVVDILTRLFRPPKQRPQDHVAGFTVVDRFDANERFREVLGEDTTGARRLLRIHRLPWDATEPERQQIRKRATWEAGILRSFGRAPEDARLLVADPPVETDEGLVVPMEYFDGQTLPAWLAEHGAGLDLRARVTLWARIARAIAWTHRSGVVHRQLRPDLVLVKGDADPRDPRTPDYRVTGFDLAKRHAHDTTIVGSTIAGGLEGAAPEVVLNPSDAQPASDQFSLGLLLALVVLRRPLVESTLPLVERRHRIPHLRDVEPDVPQRLDDAVARMLQLKPADRFRSVDEAVEHVLAAFDTASGEPVRGLQPGARVGSDYVVEKRIGDGGLSEVYQVKHRLLGERFALKVARPTDVAERAIRCEFYALQALRHESIVRAHDLTTMVEDRITLRLELVSGATLADAVTNGKLPDGDLAARRRLAEDLLAALDELERVGLTHNDLKPSNLIVRDDGRLVVIDFSLARGPAVQSRMGDVPTFGGTYEWRDPSGEPPGHATDRYAAAMCLFWLHAGRHPFDGHAPEPGEAPEIDPGDLEPEALAGFFAKALSPEPADRFRNARGMRDAYLAAVGAPVGVEGTSRVPLTTETPLADTTLSPRAVRTLAAAHVRTVGELLAVEDLERIPGLGARLAERVRELVEEARQRGVAPREREEPSGPPLYRPLAMETAPASELPVDVAILDALRLAGLRTIGDVAGRTRAELGRIPKLKPQALQALAQSLVKWHERSQRSAPVDTLDGLWERATRQLDDTQRELLELVFGFGGPPLAQGDIAKKLSSDQGTVSKRKTAALERLDREVFAPIQGALDGYLELDHGILPLHVACERLGRDFPTAAVEPSGLIRLLAALDTASFRLLESVTERSVNVLARPWCERDLLETFATTVSRIVAGWPPEPVSAVRNTLRMVLTEFEGDHVVLAQRLVTDVRVTAGGALFQPPVDQARGVLYVLDGTRDGLEHAALAAELDRVFVGHGPQAPALHELPRILEGSAWELDGTSIVRREAASTATARPKADDPRALLAIDLTVDPLDRVRDALREAAGRGGFRLVVAPPEHHRAVAKSLVEQLSATSVDLTDAWFRRNEATLASDARAPKFPAMRVAAGKRVDLLMNELVAEHGAPNRSIVVHETGILGTLGGLEQIRLLYDRVRGQPLGFWVLVIPGVITDKQPLFNDRWPVWHMPGLVLPLAEPLRP